MLGLLNLLQKFNLQNQNKRVKGKLEISRSIDGLVQAVSVLVVIEYLETVFGINRELLYLIVNVLEFLIPVDERIL